MKRRTNQPTLASFRAKVHERSGRVCQLRLPGCQGRATQAHHIHRLGQGGSNDPDNGLSLCNSCHSFVHDNPDRAAVEGWLRRQWPRPGDFHYVEEAS